jgi:hypothetical protein
VKTEAGLGLYQHPAHALVFGGAQGGVEEEAGGDRVLGGLYIEDQGLRRRECRQGGAGSQTEEGDLGDRKSVV